MVNIVKTIVKLNSFLISHTLASKRFFFLFSPFFFWISTSILYWSHGIKCCARHGLIKKPINRRARRVQLTDDNALLIAEYYWGNCLWSISTRRGSVSSEKENKGNVALRRKSATRAKIIEPTLLRADDSPHTWRRTDPLYIHTRFIHHAAVTRLDDWTKDFWRVSDVSLRKARASELANRIARKNRGAYCSICNLMFL